MISLGTKPYMTFWALLVIIVGALGVFSAILWAFLSYALRQNSRANEEFLREMRERSGARAGGLDRRKR